MGVRIEVDPTAYDCGLIDFIDSLGLTPDELESELSDLEDELEAVEDEIIEIEQD